MQRSRVFRTTMWALSVLGLTVTAVRAQQMYWIDNGLDVIQRADLDGSHIENLVEGKFGFDLELNLPTDTMYWTTLTITGVARGVIHRAKLDGASVEQVIVTDSPFGVGIAVDPLGSKIYWGELNKVRRANLNGSNIEDVATSADGVQGYVAGLALDLGAGKIYWISNCVDTGPCGWIQRSNLDGTQVEDVIAKGHLQPWRLKIDPVNAKLYWADVTRIRRANLDGTNVEDILTGLSNAMDLALDTGNGKIYWSSETTGKIQRANLDGTEVEEIVTGLGEVWGIALDLREPVPAVSGWGIGAMATFVLAAGILALCARKGKSHHMNRHPQRQAG